MNISRLRIQFLKTDLLNLKYNKQGNICADLLGKTAKIYYEDLTLSDVNDNKKCWKTV